MSKFVRVHLPAAVGDGFVTLRVHEHTTTASLKESILRTIRKKRPTHYDGVSSFSLENSSSDVIEGGCVLDLNTTDLYLRHRKAHLVRVLLPAELGSGFITLPANATATVGPFLRQVVALVNRKRGAIIGEAQYVLEQKKEPGALAPDSLLHALDTELYLKKAPEMDPTGDEDDEDLIFDPSYESDGNDKGASQTGFMHWLEPRHSDVVSDGSDSTQAWYFLLSARVLFCWPTRGDAVARKLPTCYPLLAAFRTSCRLLLLSPGSVLHLCAGSEEQAEQWMEAFQVEGIVQGLGLLGLMDAGDCSLLHAPCQEEVTEEEGRMMEVVCPSTELQTLLRDRPACLRTLYVRNESASEHSQFGEILQWVPGSSLTRLDFSGISLTEELVRHLREWGSLRTTLVSIGLHLSIQGTPDMMAEISGALLQSVAHSRVQAADLSDTPLEPSVVLTTLLNEHLTDLCLRNCKLGASRTLYTFADALAGNTHLTALDLSANSLQDHHLQALFRSLKKNRTLTRLWLRDNNMSSVKDLSAVLHVNTSLRELALSNNRFPTLQPLWVALKANLTLQCLDLSCCNISHKCVGSLCQTLKANTSLQSLSLAGNIMQLTGINTLLQTLVGHSALRFLDISDSKMDTEDGGALVSLLERNPRLTTLRANNNGLGARLLMQLEDLGNANQALSDGVQIDPRVLHFPVLSLNTQVRVVRAFSVLNTQQSILAFSVLTNTPETTAMSPSVGFLAPGSSVTIHVLVTGWLASAEAASHLLLVRIAVVDSIEYVTACPEDFWKRQQTAFRSVFVRCVGVSSLKQVPYLSNLGTGAS